MFKSIYTKVKPSSGGTLCTVSSQMFSLITKLCLTVLTIQLFVSNTYAQNDYGIEVNGTTATIYFVDQGWTGGWNYICLGDNCTAGTKVGNRWERQISGITVGQTYSIQLKIQDNSTGQYISPMYDVVASEAGNEPVEPTCSDGIQNGDETGIDCGGTDCEACATCNDGIQNGDETGIDCGGADCEPCATCNDGIQNGDETGLDCGGPDCEACDDSTPVIEPTVSIYTHTEHGLILTGGAGSSSNGLTIYSFDTDQTEFSECNDGCANSWPPVLVNSLAEVLIPQSVQDEFTGTWGVSGRCDGALQLTYNGDPLYFYVSDQVQGDTNGEGAGNVWWIVKNEQVVEPTCNDGIQNGDETGVDCGGSQCQDCPPPVVDAGTCGDYGLTVVDGKGIMYYKDDLGTALYFCTGGGFNNCVPPDRYENGYYQKDIDVTIGQTYSLAIQASPQNVEFTVVAGESSCYFVPTCNDGIQNGDETGIDCGGPECDPCPTCDDGMQNGDETGVDCGGSECQSCETICNGTPNPSATVFTTNETIEFKNDGTITFYFNDVEGRTDIQFSLDGGLSYQYASPDDMGSLIIYDLPPGIYQVYARWSNGDCPMNLGDYRINEGGPEPTCSDRILNQGEERVDCGGPCAACEESACGDIPLVNYPSPALPSPVTGITPGVHGYTFDLSEDLSEISVDYGQTIYIQSDGNPDFEFYCSCNQVEFEGVSLASGPAAVPQKCQDAGDFYYFFRYKKKDYQTDDPGDQYMYSSLFTTQGERIDPRTRETIVSQGANWMRFRHPHAYDGITEAVFDAVHNADQLRYLDRYETIITDGPDNLRIDPQLTSANGTFHPHEGAPVTPVRIDILDIGDSPAPRYATTVGGVSGTTYADLGPGYNYGNMVNYEITAVAGGSGAQTYNTLQNYFIGQGFNTLGDPRLASAGKASTLMILPSLQTAGFNETNYNLERDAIFTQHLITLTEEDDVDDFLEGHHIFHGVIHRSDNNRLGPPVLDEVQIGDFSCGSCHFRDGRGPEVIQTPRGPRVPPAVYGTGLLQWIAGAEVGLRWDGGAATVAEQTKNALVEDHKIDPDNPADISPEDLNLLIAYTEFLTVPTRSAASYNDEDVIQGEVLFHQVGCASCHSPTQRTSSDAPAEFRDLTIRPYTDMKTHTVHNGTFRTPALWGIGRNIQLLERNDKATLFMHDGTATSLDGAVQLHGGDASGSRAAYNSLSTSDQQKIIKFLESL
ncbi:di-heme oxidoredictase family protein [Sediminitomix flava]|uniref:Secreted repeat protein with Y-X4-D motif n=1 Tax=Sediminitomix flava TaxID=379075 RepID=A0A315ZFW4_SEDFL|nr:di-heme oxidoredictase family protein [Sediminitomix flava]PWJ44475.1 secreted repeat protein with Y-X4-D motif [Sediminitomix flava]